MSSQQHLQRTLVSGVAALACVFAGCSGGRTTTVPPPPPAPVAGRVFVAGQSSIAVYGLLGK